MIDLNKKLKELEENYNKLSEIIESKEKNYKEELYSLNEELLRMQGEYRLVKALIDDENNISEDKQENE